MSQPNNPPAFPRAEQVFVDPYDDGVRKRLTTEASGMSLRDWFAGQALALGGEFFHNIDDHSDPPNVAEHCAVSAYAIADAMLKAREAK